MSLQAFRMLFFPFHFTFGCKIRNETFCFAFFAEFNFLSKDTFHLKLFFLIAFILKSSFHQQNVKTKQKSTNILESWMQSLKGLKNGQKILWQNKNNFEYWLMTKNQAKCYFSHVRGRTDKMPCRRSK